MRTKRYPKNNLLEQFTNLFQREAAKMAEHLGLEEEVVVLLSIPSDFVRIHMKEKKSGQRIPRVTTLVIDREDLRTSEDLMGLMNLKIGGFKKNNSQHKNNS